MKNADNYISINIKPMYNLFNSYTLDYDIRRDYITTVHGNRLEVEGGTWYLWCDSYLITSGNTRDLHAVKNVPHHDSDGLWNDIEFDYTPVHEL